MSIQLSYSGPLPPPEVLAKYNEAIPNATEGILKLVEVQAHQLKALEKETIMEQQRQGSKG